MPDMQGKTVVVTGGNSGIGFETAAALAAMGARVLVTARNADKGRAAVAAITRAAPGRGSGPARRLRPGRPGVGAPGRGRDPRAGTETRRPRQQRGPRPDRAAETVDGYEATFATNHLGPFLLTNLLARADRGIGAVPDRERGLDGPQLRPARGSPSTTCSPRTRYRGMRVYGAVEAGQHPLHAGAGPASRGHRGHGELAASGHGAHRLRGATATPGACWPSGSRSAVPSSSRREKGARTSVYLASSPEVDGVSGEYFVKCKPKQPRRWAQDAEAARRLWQVSEELVGLAPAGRA